MSRALGLIETKGLIGAIEAADAMVKAANVTIIGKEKVDPAMITIKIAGDVAAVRAALDAGAEAAKRVGQLLSVHLIPQPDDQMIVIIPELFEISGESVPEIAKSDEKPKPKTKREEKAPDLTPVNQLPEVEIISEETREPIIDAPISTTPIISVPEISVIETIDSPEADLFDEPAEKVFEELPENFNLMESDIYTLNVHQLRKLARQIDNFPIQGREISKANRNELLKYFEALRSP